MKPSIKKLIIIILAILLLIAGCFLFLQKPETAAADWWDDSWLYRQTVGITNSGTDQTDFQAMITVDTATLITANKLQSDCDDLRLTDINGKLISHWMEPGTCNGASTKVWVKVPSITTNGATVYLYYGNSAVSSISSPADTFIREISGVQGAWDMDEASWTNDCSTSTVLDSSGNSNDGTACPNTTGPTGGATGKFGNGGLFDGSNDYVDMGGSSTLKNFEEKSVFMWMKNPGFTGTEQHILYSGYWQDPDYGEHAYILSGSNNITCKLRNSGGYSENNFISFTPDEWTHIGYTWNGSEIKTYKNGVYQSTTNFTGTLVCQYDTEIGHRYGSNPFNGSIDNVRIYNTALTQSEVSDLYGTGGDRHGYVTTNYPNKSLVRKYSASVSVGSPGSEERGPGPVAYWKFDEGFGQTANDSTINANNGTLGATSGVENSDPTWQTEDMCISGKCLKFDGVDDKTTVTDDNTLDITDAITLSSWVNVTAIPEYTALVDDASTTGQFSHRKEITITTTGTSTPANYQVKLTITHETAMQASFEDIRFNTKAGGYIDYWIETEDGSTATVWIELPDAIDDAGAGVDTIWMYYGNGDLNDGGDGDDVFLVFSDRSDVASWYGGDNPTDDGTSMKFYTTQANLFSYLDVSIADTSYTMEYYFKTVSRVGTDNGAVIIFDVSDEIAYHWHPFVNIQGSACWGSSYIEYYTSYSEGTEYIGRMTVDESDKSTGVDYYIYNTSRTLLGSATGKPYYTVDADNITRIGIGDGSGSATTLLDMRVWWLYLRKYIANEPTPTYGTEVSASSQAVLSKLDSYSLGASSSTAYATINDQTISSSISSGWNYLTLTYNKDATGTEEMKLYINGTEAATGDYSTVIATNTNNVLLGNAFDGFIDSVKIYPYARTAAQIKADYASRGTASGSSVVISDEGKRSLSDGLVGYWKMDEASWNGTADEVVDSSGSGNDGVAACTGTCTKPTTGAGKFGNGGSFDGSDDYVDLGNDNSLHNYIAKSSFLWVKIPAFTGSFRYLVYDGYFDSPYGDIMYLSSTANTCSIYLKNTSGTAANNSFTFTPDEWTMIGFTWDGSTVRYYKDGAEIGTPDVFTGTLGCSALNLFLGINREVDSWFNGSIDSVRIYNRALSPGEVRDLYNFAPGPVGWWKMDEKVSGNGQTINDSSGYGNTGTTSSANGTGMDCMVPGKYGSACEFDGVDDYVDAGNDSSLDITGNLTISLWIYMNGWGESNYGRIVSRRSSTLGYEFSVANPAGEKRLGFVANGTAYYSNDNIINTGDWYYVSAVRENGVVTFYANGISNGTVSVPTINSASTNIRIGCRNWEQSRYFNGSIDDVRIYNYARTQAQILEDYSGGRAQKQPIGHWKFDEGYGTTANNSGIGGSSLNGTLTNMASPATSTSGWTDSGKIGKGLVFDGNNDYVDCGSDSSLDIGTGDFSVEFWMKSTQTGSTFRTVQKRGIGASGAQGGWQVSRNSGSESNDWRNTTFDDGAGNYIRISDDGNLDNVLDGNFHYLVFVWAGSTDTLTAYIDGTNAGISTSTVGTVGSISTSRNCAVGAAWDSAVTQSQFFNGSIDDVKVYNYALTEDDIRQEYNQGALLKLGSTGTDSSGNPDDSQSREYCIPGDTSTCNPPVGRWDFNEGTGDTVNDISGNANTGTWSGTGSHWTTGKIGKGGSFNGSDDYVNCGDNTSLKPSQITICTWIKSDDQLGWAQVYGSYHLYGAWLALGSNERIAFYTNSDSWTDVTGVLAIGEWNFICATFNGTTKFVYLNGAYAGQKDYSGNLDWTGTTQLRIGRSQGGVYPFNGSIDQVRIYDYARTPAQVAWDYNRGKPVAHWKFDECQGGTAYDSSGNENDGTITIGATVPQTALGTCTSGASTDAWYNGRSGKYSSAMSFDGVDDWVDCGNGGSLNITGAITLEVWVKPSAKSTHRSILEKGDSYTDDYGLWTRNVENEDFGLLIKSTGYEILTGGSVTVDNWYHVVGTYDKDAGSNNVKLYVNGIEVASRTQTGNIILQNQNLVIGKAVGGLSHFNGLIDEVKIYNYALTAEQIKMEYNGGAVSFR